MPEPLPPLAVTVAPGPRHTGRKILAVLALVALAVSLIVNAILLVLFLLAVGLNAGATGPASHVTQEVYQQGGADKIAILPAMGTVDEGMAEHFREYINAIRADHAIRAVIIEVDSPGGTIAASDHIHHLVSELAQDYPVSVAMDGLAASGGYYISAPARTIYARPSTLTGSIGVVWPAFEVSGLLQKIGVTPEIITSDQAIYKEVGSPLRKFTAADRVYIKDLVNAAHAQFRDVVEAGRKGRLKVPMADVAVGRIWTAQDALKMGLIDKIAYLDEVCQDVAADAGLHHPTVVRLGQRMTLLDALGVAAHLQSPKVELSPKMLFDLQATRPEYRYLSPTAPQ